MSDAFTTWTSENHLWQLLKFIQFTFEHVGACVRGKVANSNAVEMIHQNKVEFSAKVKECIRIGRDQLYDVPTTDDKHYITFERFDKEIHGPTLESIKNQTDISMSPPTSGVSWLL